MPGDRPPANRPPAANRRPLDRRPLDRRPLDRPPAANRRPLDRRPLDRPPAADARSTDAPVIDVEGGTTEASWGRCVTLADMALLELPRLGHAVVVAPHPDDEVLGLGGTLCWLACLGWRIELIAVTDGEASHPGSDRISPQQLRRERPVESAGAMSHLGISLVGEHRLSMPDGEVSSHYSQLVGRIVDLVPPGAWLFATWRHDGHPDHEAVGWASAEAARTNGARLVEYPVWMWTWALPGDGRVPWADARAIALNPTVRAAKAKAIASFRSQLVRHGPSPEDGPVLPPTVLEHFSRPFETVLI